MAGSNQYRDYIKRSFLRFAFSIIALLFVLVGLFLFMFRVGGKGGIGGMGRTSCFTGVSRKAHLFSSSLAV